MNIDAITNTIRIICEVNAQFNDHNRKDLLQAIYYLADLCSDHLSEQGGEGRYWKSWNEIALIKQAAEDGLMEGDLPTAFRKASDASLRVVETPDEP